MEVKNKSGVVDQILLWMTLIVAFVVLFFIVIDYSTISRIKSNMDQMAQYAVRMIALDRDNADIATSLNSMKVSYFADITGDDISCTEAVATTGVNEYQVVLAIRATYAQSRVLNFTDTIEAKIATFNESNSNFINCTLNLSAQ